MGKWHGYRFSWRYLRWWLDTRPHQLGVFIGSLLLTQTNWEGLVISIPSSSQKHVAGWWSRCGATDRFASLLVRYVQLCDSGGVLLVYANAARRDAVIFSVFHCVHPFWGLSGWWGGNNVVSASFCMCYFMSHVNIDYVNTSPQHTVRSHGGGGNNVVSASLKGQSKPLAVDVQLAVQIQQWQRPLDSCATCPEAHQKCLSAKQPASLRAALPCLWHTFGLDYFNLFLQCAWSSPHLAGFLHSRCSPQVFSLVFPNFSHTCQRSCHFFPSFPHVSSISTTSSWHFCISGHPQLQGKPAGGCGGDPGVHPRPLDSLDGWGRNFSHRNRWFVQKYQPWMNKAQTAVWLGVYHVYHLSIRLSLFVTIWGVLP